MKKLPCPALLKMSKDAFLTAATASSSAYRALNAAMASALVSPVASSCGQLLKRVAGYPVVMAVEPNAGNPARGKGDTTPAEQLLVTVFANTTGDLPVLNYLAASGRLLYADTKMAPVAWPRAGEIPRQAANLQEPSAF